MFSPRVGRAYKLVLSSQYANYTDIYTVLGVLSYDEAISGSMKLSDIFTTSGQTIADMEKMELKLRADRILKVKSVTNDTKILIPMCLLEYEPDPGIQKYLDLDLVVDLGIFDSTDDINYVVSAVQDILSSGAGVGSTPKLVTKNVAWLTEEEYAAIETERKEYKSRVVNLHTENSKLIKQLEQCNTKLQMYEEMIAQLTSEQP